MKKPVCFGAGLVALDVILNGSPATLPKLSAGGSCGNVLAILAYLGWDSYPIARLSNNQAGLELVRDLSRWQIHSDHLILNEDGSTPIIIHRIKRDKSGKPIHRFEFRDPNTGSWLPRFKPITKNLAAEILQSNPRPQVFYFDRPNPGTFELAKSLKAKGSVIFFEPSSMKDLKEFSRFLSVTDILKFSHERIPEYRTHFKKPQCFLEIETRGKDGLLFRTQNSASDIWQAIPGFQLPEIVDGAGAGDWCTAGIIHTLCSQGISSLKTTAYKSITNALHQGSAMGAMNCLYDGARGLMYHYQKKKLLSLISNFILSGKINTKILNRAPLIDISTKLEFSDLYKHC